MITPNGSEILKYTAQNYDGQDIEAYYPIRKPVDVIYHILEKELNLIDNMDFENITYARGVSINLLDFSLAEEMDAKALFQDISKSSNIIPKFTNNSKYL